MTGSGAQSSQPISTADEVEELRARVVELTGAVAARDTFITVAAHELRNPMMPILGQIDLLITALRAHKYTPEQAVERLHRVQGTVQQYLKRAAVLLDVSRINSGSFRLARAPCDLAQITEQVVENFAASAQHARVSISLDARQPCPGLWDRLAVEQVIDNLVSNAIKYGGGTAVDLVVTREAQTARIRVRDRGPGIPAQARARIFGRFERAVGHSEYRSGFGVGLWVVGQLVEAMDGKVTVEDAPGGGALFEVKLPIENEEHRA
jgi:two-component system OmpR family sensor kinase